MPAVISTIAIGILIAVMGVINMTGNISTLHWYHRQRVSEEDRKPFGKHVGLGTLLCGLACIAFGLLFLAFEITARELFVWIGIAVLFAGMAAGILITLKAMIKYNKGIF